MATYTDDFNRSDGPLGGNWDQLSWSDTSASISSNEAEGSGSGNAFYRWAGGGTWDREQESTITLSGTNVDRLGPCVYMSDAGGCYYARVRADNGFTELRKVPNTGGDGTVLTDSDYTLGALSNGDTITLKAEASAGGGTTLSLYINDVIQANNDSNTTYDDDSSAITSGDVGWCLESFWRRTIDAWEGDDFAVAASETVTATVTDASGTALANETGIDWAWTDSFSGNPTDTGTGESTDGSGEIVVDVPNTGLSSGQFGYLRVRLSNGDVGIAKEAID